MRVRWLRERDVLAVAQTAYLGYGARWTESKEQTALSGKQDEILGNAREFYEAIAEAFPEIDDVFTGTIEPSELRGGGSRTSLLASSTTIRPSPAPGTTSSTGSAGRPPGGRIVGKGYVAEPWTRDQIVKAFSNLPSMDAGSDKVLNRFWKGLNVIEAPYAAPTAPGRQRPHHEHGNRQERRVPGPVTVSSRVPGQAHRLTGDLAGAHASRPHRRSPKFT